MKRMSDEHTHIVAVFQGSFDPVTFGHLDVVRRAARLFNELVVGIGHNPDKEQLFTPAERLSRASTVIVRVPGSLTVCDHTQRPLSGSVL